MNAVPLPVLLLALAVAVVYLFLTALSIKRTELDLRNGLYPAWLTVLALSCVTFDPRLQTWIDLPETLLLIGLLYHVGRVHQEQTERDLALTTLGYLLTALAGALQLGHVGLDTLLPILNLTLLLHATILYLRARPDQRWAVKHLAAAVYLVSGYQSLVQLGTLLHWTGLPDPRLAQPLIYLLALPFVVLFATRTPSLGIKLHISRHAAHLAMLLILTLGVLEGLYLLHHATGLLARSVERPWWAYLSLAVAAPLLGWLVVRRQSVQSFINQHFYNFKYDYRDSWLGVTKKLSSTLGDDQRLHHTAIDLYRETFDCRQGALWLRQGSGYVLMESAGQGFPQSRVPADDPIVRFLATWQWVVDLKEWQAGKELYPGLEAPAWMTHSTPPTWLVIPLLVNADLYGFVTLGPSSSRRHIDWEDIDLAKTMGRQMAVSLLQANSARELAEAKQFNAYTKLATYVIHDLKNIISQLDLINRNYPQHRDNPDFLDDMHQTLGHAVDKMRELLKRINATTPPTEGRPETLDLHDLMASLEHRYSTLPTPDIHMEFHLPATGIALRAERGRLLGVLGNIVNNALEAVGEGGQVIVGAGADAAGWATITVEDDGVGMSEDFIRTRLFRPFETTKGIEGMGIGMYEAKEYIQGLGGEILVESEEGEGTRVTVRLPRAG